MTSPLHTRSYMGWLVTVAAQAHTGVALTPNPSQRDRFRTVLELVQLLMPEGLNIAETEPVDPAQAILVDDAAIASRYCTPKLRVAVQTDTGLLSDFVGRHEVIAQTVERLCGTFDAATLQVSAVRDCLRSGATWYGPAYEIVFSNDAGGVVFDAPRPDRSGEQERGAQTIALSSTEQRMLTELESTLRHGMSETGASSYDIARHEEMLLAVRSLQQGIGFTDDDRLVPVDQLEQTLRAVTSKICVSVFVVRDGRLMLMRRRESGQWDLLSGYADPGDPPVGVALKEANEELGVDIDVTGLLGIVDGMRASHTTDGPICTIALTASLRSSDLVCDAVEMSDIGWFTHDELPSPLSGVARTLASKAFNATPLPYVDSARPPVVLWDIDGTLLNADAFDTAMEHAAFADVFGEQPTAIGDHHGRTHNEMALSAAALLGRSPADVEAAFAEALEEYFVKHQDDFVRSTHVIPGVRDLLGALASAGFVQTVLTGNTARCAQLKLSLSGLAENVDLQVGAYGDDHHDRAALGAVALDRIKSVYGYRPAPDRVVIIGESPRDIQCANDNGFHVIAVASGTYSVEQLTLHEPSVVVDDLSDTTAVLRTLTSLSRKELGTPCKQ